MRVMVRRANATTPSLNQERWAPVPSASCMSFMAVVRRKSWWQLVGALQAQSVHQRTQGQERRYVRQCTDAGIATVHGVPENKPWKQTMNAVTRFSVSILAGLEALLMAFGHPDWAIALWAVATAPAQAARATGHEPWP